MFEVALSRRMCCSRVCMAIRRAGLPRESIVTPIMRPGIRREYLLLGKRGGEGEGCRRVGCGGANAISSRQIFAYADKFFANFRSFFGATNFE